MRVAALSDFHIGAHGYTDSFEHPFGDFEVFLDGLEREHDAIVLLGDIWQTDHTGVPGRSAAARQLAAARGRVARLAARLSEPPYLYVHGNHDAIARDELGAPESVRLDTALFIHGHQFDPVAIHAPWAAAAGTWATGRLRRVGLRPVARWLEGRDIAIKDGRFRGPAGPYARAAERLGDEHGAAFVVMGHTHVPSCQRVGQGVVAINTGTCSGGRRMYASIDTDAGTANVYDGPRRLTQWGAAR